jgi:hypothetical protein
MPVTINGSTGLTSNSGSVFTDANGNAGIGTSNPTARLHVVSGNGQIIAQATSGNPSLLLRPATNNREWEVFSGSSNGQFGVYDGVVQQIRLAIDTGGRVTTPAQPAFVAKGIPSNVTSGVVLFGSSSIPLNVGSSYSQATGRFTAPIAGNYLITVVGMAQTNFYTSSVRVNASEFAQFRTNDGSVGNYMQGTISLIIPLAASDYVDLSIGSGTFGGNAQEVIFSGYLLG